MQELCSEKRIILQFRLNEINLILFVFRLSRFVVRVHHRQVKGKLFVEKVRLLKVPGDESWHNALLEEEMSKADKSIIGRDVIDEEGVSRRFRPVLYLELDHLLNGMLIIFPASKLETMANAVFGSRGGCDRRRGMRLCRGGKAGPCINHHSSWIVVWGRIN